MCLDKKEIYSQYFASLRATDEISFKLLGLVPSATVTAVVVAMLKGEALWSKSVFGLSLVGAFITLGLYRWELRNIKTCSFLLGQIENLDHIDRSTLNTAPGLFRDFLKIDKTKSEKWIYSVTVSIWLGMPWAIYAAWAATKEMKDIVLPMSEIPMSFRVMAAVVMFVVVLSASTNTKPSNNSQRSEETCKVISDDQDAASTDTARLSETPR